MSPAPKKSTEEPTTCPWCSATVPAAAATCPSCGASLHEAAEGDILGVTQIDPAAVSRASRIKPSRIATWLGAEPPPESSDLGGRIEPPSKEVREEMLRLELAALDAELEAKATQVAANRELPDLDDPDTAPIDAPTPDTPTSEAAPPIEAPSPATSQAPSDDAGGAKPG
jgi:hypothetical protein